MSEDEKIAQFIAEALKERPLWGWTILTGAAGNTVGITLRSEDGRHERHYVTTVREYES